MIWLPCHVSKFWAVTEKLRYQVFLGAWEEGMWHHNVLINTQYIEGGW